MTGDFRNENESASYDSDDFLAATGNSIVESVEVSDRFYTPGKGAFETSSNWTSGWTR